MDFKYGLFVICFLLFIPAIYFAQNYIKNPDFLLKSICPSTYGQVSILNDWESRRGTPDYYDSCATSFPYKIPINGGCKPTYPFKDNGIVGFVSYGIGRESFEQRIRNLPIGKQLYARMMVTTNSRCNEGTTLSNFCFTNNQGMGIEYEDGKVTVIGEAVKIIDNPDIWTKVEGCYTPTGKETKFIIDNFQADGFAKTNCLTKNDFNLGYSYVDNILFTPFDPLPEKLVVCNNKTRYFDDLKFYDLKFNWKDGVDGSGRVFTKTGGYLITAESGNCTLTDSIYVVVIDDSKKLDSTIIKCENAYIKLTSIVQEKTIWNGVDSSNSISVLKPGIYIAISQTTCGLITENFTLTDRNCSKFISAPNVIKPDQTATFYFETILPLDGKLSIFDRWGNLVHHQKAELEMKWDGHGMNQNKLSMGVYLWTYRDDKNKLYQSGDITIIE